MDIEIKELTKDLLNNCSYFLDTLSNLRETVNLSLEKQIDILDKINFQDGHIFVAIKDNKEIISTSTILIEQKYIRNGAKIGHIEDVATNKNYEGKGIGKKVVEECISYAKKRGCYKVILDCSDELINFYNYFGFCKSENHMRLNL